MFYSGRRGKSMKKRQEQLDENKIEKMMMTTMKGSLGDAFIKAWSRGRTPMTLTNEGTSGRLSTNEDVASKPRWITRGDIKLHGTPSPHA